MSGYNQGAIGIFDSGVGGLSVAIEIRKALPAEHLIYLGDQANVPYGTKSLEQIQKLSEGITRFLLAKGAKIIVVACNTASAASLQFLREKYPNTPFVGMEPAIKPASETTQTGAIGVLATPATFKGNLYFNTLRRYAGDKQVFEDTCPGLVEQIEKGEVDTIATRSILERSLTPMLAAGVDSVVLGCTHYPFVLPLVRQIVGTKVSIINPAPAVARQVCKVLAEQGELNLAGEPGGESLITTGDLDSFEQFVTSMTSFDRTGMGLVEWGKQLG